MKTDNAALSDFEQFMMIRLKASTDFLEGNFDSLKDLSVTSDPATIFPPHGIYISGVSQVNDFNQKGASNFLPHAENEFEVIHQDASNSLAYWTGIQRSSVKMTGQDAPVIFNLRVTEIFRREHGSWKLAHRHADRLAE
ncbi:MAG: nuclear transport factor 2 family protein [Sphingobacterium sp.]|jgi:ketosteroid isomerase-like protein|uniref:YybH family protein n=1 Tax=unclassified Sphingobacterium TaxID=2609468 RepID=UPI002846262B|nr:nuclear transport factor 2 family protein [Sphingobacterium sp.]MDR3006946.1 nuclear transport factor 2 family protein [Sphingobacterium sp.]